jgi:GT2 family glycosyltransferase
MSFRATDRDVQDHSRAIEAPREPETKASVLRPQAAGKFLWVSAEKFYVRGVTYGTFRPNGQGDEFHDAAKVQRDFALMAANGFNAVRTYTVPPRWMLDLAQEAGLRVMIGLPWEQHIDFLADSTRPRAIAERVRTAVAGCAGHPAVLCYAVGNEVPATIARWLGRRRLEKFLHRLYLTAKEADPDGIVTYVNYPSTEYLELPFLDLACFNVYLERQETLEAYLARLHNLVGDRPLLMAEIGLDSRRHGELGQAASLEWQVRSSLAAGCAGAFVFAWTDEWYRGGFDIEDWDFGITTRQRQPKPALNAVREAFAEVPFPKDIPWPRVSVIVCTHNGSRTLGECLTHLTHLDYPDYEVIVVDDGSTDRVPAIASEFNVRLIRTQNRGLSSARNTGLAAATGQLVAYIDDDAYPDPHWLKHLSSTFLTASYVAVGGPNLLPPGDGATAECVFNAPGGPNHVLLTDCEAEHIPGCNMAFGKKALEAIGGFDPQFRAAGDDVDVCWRLQERGWKIGFNPAAVVWHHRRNSVRAYLKQQLGYGKAEALLERKWPDKYNAGGHIRWGGRIYNASGAPLFGQRTLIYHGLWGTAPFQTRHETEMSWLHHLPSMPEWLLVIAGLGALSFLGILWPALLGVLPALLIAIAVSLFQAWAGTSRSCGTRVARPWHRKNHCRALTFSLFLLQPLARLWGRVRHGLVLGLSRKLHGFCWPLPARAEVWFEQWQSSDDRLKALESTIRSRGGVTTHGGDYSRWDLEVRGGLLAAARVLMAVEEHGAGKQLLRFRFWPAFQRHTLGMVGVLVLLTALAGWEGELGVALLLGLLALFLGTRMILESGSAMAVIRSALAPEHLRKP